MPAENATTNATNASAGHHLVPKAPAPAAPPHVAASTPFHVWLGRALLALALVASVALVVAAVVRAPKGRRTRDALEAVRRAFVFCVLPMALLETYAFRWELALASLWVFEAILGAVHWFGQFTTTEKVLLICGALVALAEIAIVEFYFFGYRYLYREWKPDLALRTPGSSTLRLVGRVYAVHETKTGHDIIFAKRGGGALQWWKGLHRIESLHAPGPQRKRTRVLEAGGLVQSSKDPFSWTLTDEPLGDHPLHTDSSQNVISRVLADNSRASKDASEGNPHYIARRIMEDPTSSASVGSWRSYDDAFEQTERARAARRLAPPTAATAPGAPPDAREGALPVAVVESSKGRNNGAGKPQGATVDFTQVKEGDE